MASTSRDDAQISLLEWVDNLAKLPGLKTLLSRIWILRPASSPPISVSSRRREARPTSMILEMNENRTDEENEKLESKRNDVSKLRAKIVW